MTSLEEGRAAVGLARRTLEECLEWPEAKDPASIADAVELPALFEEKRGLFVTLLLLPGSDLRGCIGFTEPIYPLRQGIPRAALYAAREDPRFPPLERAELERVRIEVSLLTPPEPIVARAPADLVGLVQVGRDGLMVAENGMKGVLLPQVPVDEGWDVPTFLSHTCIKAGLSPEAWRRAGPRFWRFRSEIFAEARPRGAVEEHPLAPPTGAASPSRARSRRAADPRN